MRMSRDALSTPSTLGAARDLAPALGLPVERLAVDGGDHDRLFQANLDAVSARPEPTVVIGDAAHQKLGVEFLRRVWVTLDLIWVGASVVTGGIALGLGPWAGLLG